MKDIKTKELSQSIKKLDRKKHVKTFTHTVSTMPSYMKKKQKEQNGDNYAVDTVTSYGNGSAKNVLFNAKQIQNDHRKRKLKKEQRRQSRDQESSIINDDVAKDKKSDSGEGARIESLGYEGYSVSKKTIKSNRVKSNANREHLSKKESKSHKHTGISARIKNENNRPKLNSHDNKFKKNHLQKKDKTSRIHDDKSSFFKKRMVSLKNNSYQKTTYTAVTKGVKKSVRKLFKLNFQIRRLVGIGTFGIAIIVLIFLISMFAALSEDSPIETSSLPLSEDVLNHRNTIKKYADKYDMNQYISLIEAVMMQESGGKGNDPMQASECSYNQKYPQKPNGISDPDYSIESGVKYLSECLKKAKVKNNGDTKQISLALQGYNYGPAYIDWAVEYFGGYTKANATVYSDEMKAKLKINTYGDVNYVQHVLQYYHVGEIVPIAISQVGNVGGKPYWTWYGYPHRVEWCACFVSWVLNEAGLLEQGIAPKFSNCEAGIKWFKEHKKWKGREVIPEPSYIIFFDYNQDGTSDHVGIVEKVEANMVYTIEGNSVGDECRQQSYALNSIYIVGFGEVNSNSVN